MHKVLLVEDDEDIQKMWKEMWEFSLAEETRKTEIVFISAFSLKEAEKKFFTEAGWTAVVIDACVRDNQPNTPPLVKKIRTTFNGPIIAVSGNSDYQNLLMAAGCSHKCDKTDLPNFLIKVLCI